MFFGDSRRKLYGVYDAPTGARRRSHAVLLCYPGVQEYGTSHWSFRRLAAMLARDGHHVLRFDYFGTGDSAGTTEEGSPEVWIRDIEQAASELSELSRARRLSILGKRLGAALAVLACEELVQADRLLLWDPVVSGSDYVRELETWDARRNLLLLHAERSRGAWRNELLGYRFPAHLREALGRLDLIRELPRRCAKVAIFGTEERTAYGRLAGAYRAAGVDVTLKLTRERNEDDGEASGRAQLAGSILNDMANALGEDQAA